MTRKLQTFAIAMVLAGATVTATRAPAAQTTTTNTQVLDNISVQLKIYSQGSLSSNDKSLPAVVTTLSTSDLIKQLATLAGFTYEKSQKLVLSMMYSNYVVGTPGTTVTNSQTTLSSIATNFHVMVETSGGSLILPIVGTPFTNSFLLSNQSLYYSSYSGTGTEVVTNVYYESLTNNLILTNTGTGPTNTVVTVNTNVIYVDPRVAAHAGELGYWTTIVPVVSATATNIVITQMSPQTNTYFTNSQNLDSISVMTPKSGSTPAVLYSVDNWLQWDQNSGGTTIYAETGNDLSSSNFAGTNIFTQTEYSTADLNIFTVYPTNTPAGFTNLSLDPMGFSKAMTKLVNLTVNGNSKDKAVFQVIGSETVDASGSGYIGGTFVGTNSYNVVGGVTNYNTYFNGNYLGESRTNYVNNPGGNYLENTIPVVYEGSISLTYLSDEPVIVPVP